MRIIDINESTKSKEKLSLKPLTYSRGALAPVLSKENLDLHYGKLAKGYVDRFNSGEGDPIFNEAGAFLHNIYFEQLCAPKSCKLAGAISIFILEKFGDIDQFKNDFEKEAMSIQGSGWIYLSTSGKIKTIKNHAIRSDILLLVDWWEHAWLEDYGTDKKKYLKNHWDIFDWDKISEKL
jgi:Fe-Mn family superoxide dismutase